MLLTLILLTPTFLILLLCWLNRYFDAPEDQPRAVYHPRYAKALLLFGIFCFAFGAIGMSLTPGFTQGGPVCALLTLVVSLFVPSIFICGVRYGKNGLSIRTYWGRVHQLRWEDVTALTTWAAYGKLFISTADKAFLLNNAAMGCPEFLLYAGRKCQEHGVKPQLPHQYYR